MADKTLSVQEISDSTISGIPPGTLAGWIDKGVITPEVPGRPGRGRHAEFTIMQALGIAIAAELCRQPQGCRTEHVGTIVDAFAAMPESELLKAFQKDGTAFVMVDAGGTPVLRGKAYDWPDVQEMYLKIMKVADKPAKHRTVVYGG
jgi:hypothetical protein